MTKAYDSGMTDGHTWAQEQERDPQGQPLDKGLNRAGKERESASLINACMPELLASVLGLTVEQVKAESPDYHAALDDYDRGWDDGIRDVITAAAPA
jgi:hypothetical protein